MVNSARGTTLRSANALKYLHLYVYIGTHILSSYLCNVWQSCRRRLITIDIQSFGVRASRARCKHAVIRVNCSKTAVRIKHLAFQYEFLEVTRSRRRKLRLENRIQPSYLHAHARNKIFPYFIRQLVNAQRFELTSVWANRFFLLINVVML